MRFVGILLCILLGSLASSAALAYTLSFDDIPTGSDLTYYNTQHGIMFSSGFEVVNHTGASWGLPHSGANVLTWTADASHVSRIEFGETTRYSVASLGGYFSTDTGIVVKATAYHGTSDTPVSSVLIGAPEESWSNQYVEITSPGSNIDFIIFEGVGSADTRLGFSVDDMVVVPAP